MIDFRYHLVSLISVFLALAVGIVLGAGPLKQPIGESLQSQVEGLRTDRDHLRSELDTAHGDVEKLNDFVVAEALTNIAKHAGATRAEVAVTGHAGSLQVRVRDDGRGGARVHRDGLSTGLAGLTDRVRATGGSLTVSSPPAEGTELRAVIPLHPVPPTSRAAARPADEETVR